MCTDFCAVALCVCIDFCTFDLCVCVCAQTSVLLASVCVCVCTDFCDVGLCVCVCVHRLLCCWPLCVCAQTSVLLALYRSDRILLIPTICPVYLSGCACAAFDPRDRILNNTKTVNRSTDRQTRYPRVPRRGSAAARLVGLRVRIPPAAWMCFCCVLSGRGFCDKLITRPEESYRLWCVVVFDLETS